MLYRFVKNSYGRRSNETKEKDMETLQFSLNLQLFSDSKIPGKDIELLRSGEINYYARYIYYLINIKFSLPIDSTTNRIFRSLARQFSVSSRTCSHSGSYAYPVPSPRTT